MSHWEFELRGVGDPRLAVHATSAVPAWLWSIDGSRVLWANPVGARLFGSANSPELAKKTFGPADSYRRQIAQLAGQLPPAAAARLERLRGFGAAPGALMTCACARLAFPDGSHGILITAAETSGRAMPLIERLQRLVEGVETPIVAFARDGLFVGASDAARALLGFPDLSAAGLNAARNDALANGRVEMPIGTGHMVLQRVGRGSDIGLIALIAPGDAVSDEATAESETQPEWQQPFADRETTAEESAAPAEAAHSAPEALQPADAPAAPAAPAPRLRRHPLRFTWQMDIDERFSLGSDEFTRLIGPRTAVGFGRPWREIAETYGLDPSGRVLEAIATRETWSGIAIYWPVDGGGRLPVELSGLPVYDSARNFAGYRGFGVCRVLDSLAHLEELRGLDPTDDSLADSVAPPIHSADTIPTESRHALAAEPPATSFVVSPAPLCAPPGTPASIADDTPQTDLDEPVEMPENVVPFRPIGEQKSPALTAVENNAFDELARQLSARLDRDNGETEDTAPGSPFDQPVNAPPGWLAHPEPPPRGESWRDRALLDLLPSGILIYRLDRLLYANPAFLQRIGYDSLHALEQAGGLETLYVEPGVSSASSTSETGTPVTISASQDSSGPSSAIEARLFTISWDGDSALALVFSPNQVVVPPAAAPVAVQEAIQAPVQEPIPEPDPEPVQATPPIAGQASAEDLAAILDTTTEGIVMFDAEGNIHACNRSAEALFGYDGAEFVRHNLADLFAPESRRVVFEYLENIKGAGTASLLDHGSDVLGVSRGPKDSGGIIPLSMTMGRTRPDGPNFFAVFRDNAQSSKAASEPPQARPPADRAATTKSDMLARISHEVRTPLNAILGLSEVMLGEQFGALGNERYIEYTRDIRASGERVIAIINDLLELSRIETGKLDLAFADQNLNEMVESCVSAMQPHANRERIIIRTSLAQALPSVVADGPALRQITLNLIGNSIHLANPAGQVIVSTALSDFGEVVLRVRDTGHGLNDNEIAAAMEPFRNPQSSEQASDSSAVNLSLTKALVEANRARFHIKTGGRSGTLIEVVFPHAMARA
jgi:PAS domain S-box-containing protein